MQYPREDISGLERIFPAGSGVTLVENKSNFEAVLAHSKYADYFIDVFRATPAGAPWGHCTPKGYRLIADNLLRVLQNSGGPMGQSGARLMNP
jgi:hypothetical protein